MGEVMTIYDAPVADTKFFPVDGDTMRQMKHEEDTKKDTGSSAKNESDAFDSITHIGEQAMLHISVSHDDLVVHPIWCDPNQCIAPDPMLRDDRRLHRSIIGKVAAAEGKDLEVTLVKFEDREPAVIVGDVELDADGIDDLVNLLFGARWDLTYAGKVD